jgi:hypothetical protein
MEQPRRQQRRGHSDPYAVHDANPYHHDGADRIAVGLAHGNGIALTVPLGNGRANFIAIPHTVLDGNRRTFSIPHGNGVAIHVADGNSFAQSISVAVSYFRGKWDASHRRRFPQ